MSSKRLPGKVLLNLGNKTVLGHIIYQLKRVRNKKRIIVLTSSNKSDDLIAKFCKQKKITYFRGDLNNVYKRYIQAIKKFKNKMFVRINGDSPMINYKLIDNAIRIFKSKKYDLVTNCQFRSFPKGQSVEIINSKIFVKNFKFIKTKRDKEHVFLYFYKNFSKFKIFNILSKLNNKNKNQSIDTIKDYLLIKKLIEKHK